MRRLIFCLFALGLSSCPSGGGGSGSPAGNPSPDPLSIVYVDAGHLFTCVLISDGRISCWGAGDSGELGYGNRLNRNTSGEAIRASGIVSQISTGGSFACALISDGGVSCWGSGTSGKLGYGNISDRLEPGEAIPGFGSIAQISVGGTHVCAVTSDNKVHCWGDGSSNKLGYGNNAARNSPGEAIPDFGNITQVSVGSFHVCALNTMGRVHCWGEGLFGRLGYGNVLGRSSPGDAIPGLENVTHVSAESAHSCSLMANGSVHCWGDGTEGRLGYGNTSDRNSPGEPIPGLENVRQIETGAEHTCALLSGGSVHCWGQGEDSQLGYGNTSDRLSPGEAIPGLSNISQISVGSFHTCALGSNGSVYCWGQGTRGELGNGNATNQAFPGEPISFPFLD